jgi:hypothetical protein
MANVDPAETLADVRCVECGGPHEGDDRWHLLFADSGEVAIYCSECGERGFEDE